MSINMPLISVIVPVYNVGTYLLPCLDSLMAQTYRNLEILLIDDGSTDASGMHCDAYAQKDSRFKVIHKENGGVSSARNLGLELAKGEYIGFVDADDRIESDYFEILYKEISEQNADVVCCNFQILDDDGQRLPDHSRGAWGVCPNVKKDRVITDINTLFADILDRRELYFTHVNAKLMRAEMAKQCRFQMLKFSEDTLFMFEVFCLGPTVCLMTYPGYHYVLRASSVTHSAPTYNLRYGKDSLLLASHEYDYFVREESALCDRYLEAYADAIHAYAYLAAQAENHAQRETVRKELIPHLKKILPMRKKLSAKLHAYILLYAKLPWMYHFLIGMKVTLRGLRKS